MNGISARNRSSVRGLPADDAAYYRQHLDSGSAQIPASALVLFTLYERMGWYRGDNIPINDSLAQLAARPVLGVAGVQRTETQV